MSKQTKDLVAAAHQAFAMDLLSASFAVRRRDGRDHESR
jgi:hypothetical protein